MTTKAQRKAIAKYQKDKVVTKKVQFYPGEKDILDHLKKQESMQGYIKDLIRKDMQK